MATKSAQVTVSHTAATLISQASSGKIVVYNSDGTNPIYLGGAGVTSSTGFEVLHGVVTQQIDLGDADDGELYAIAGTANVTAHVLQTCV